MKLGSPIRHRKARIEIIPLIDIMFFLLACFMMVSLTMINMKGVKVNLPTATTATPENKSDFVSLTIDKKGNVFMDKRAIGRNELKLEMEKLYAANKNVRIFISGDRETLHGDVIGVLDRVRAAGIQTVGFEIRNPPPSSAPPKPQP